MKNKNMVCQVQKQFHLQVQGWQDVLLPVFHQYLVSSGIQRAKLGITTEAKKIYFSGEKSEALKMFREAGYSGTDQELFNLMDQIGAIGKEYRGFLDTAVNECSKS